jgi:hypothetical protein
MGKKELRGRSIWQNYSGANAAAAEKGFYGAFETIFKGTVFQIRAKPKEFKRIYTNVTLNPNVNAQIYCPKEEIKLHGISPDYAIDNTGTKKTLYVEVKRQDGWIEGGKRSDGRGNAHERSCKYFTPGLLEVMRNQGGIKPPALPFWTVFLGDITRDPCRVREITLWYKGVQDHFFFWRNPHDAEALISHFENKLKNLLN